MTTNKLFNFESKIIVGFILTLLAAIIIGLASLAILKNLELLTEDFSLKDAQDLINVEKMAQEIETTVSSGRGSLLSNDNNYLVRLRNSQNRTQEILKNLLITAKCPNCNMHYQDLNNAYLKYIKKLNSLVRMRKNSKSMQSIIDNFENILRPIRKDLDNQLQELRRFKTEDFNLKREKMLDSFSSSRQLMFVVISISLLLAGALAFIFSQGLSKLYSKAKEESIVREEVLAIVAHDLKNPLSAIKLNIQILKNNIENDLDKVALSKKLHAITRSLSTMESLIKDLLTAACLESKEIILEKEQVDIIELLNDISHELKPIAQAKNIKIVHENTNTHSVVPCDPKRIQQVISNLIGNAIKFSPQNSTIKISTYLQEDEQYINIQDEGPGISKEKIPYIFLRFKQANKEDARMGSGLGLYISKMIIDAHHGKIWVSTDQKYGATFQFKLPLVSPS